MKKTIIVFMAGIVTSALVILFIFPPIGQIVAEKMVVGFLTDPPQPIPFHTFGPEDIAILLSDDIQVSKKTAERIVRALKKEYATLYDIAANPPSSDREMVSYLERSGILSELNLDREEALREIGMIDSSVHYLEPAEPFTQYHALAPPDVSVRLAAEFEKIGSVTLAWPIYYPYRWKHHAQFAGYVVSEAKANIIVPNRFWQKGVELFMTQKRIPLDRVRFIYVPSEDVWTRDYGPTTVESVSDDRMFFISNTYLTNKIPYQKGDSESAIEMGRYFGLPVHRLPLVVEGGNIVTDGQGTFIMHDSVLHRNPDVNLEKLEKIMGGYYGCKRLILFPELKGELTGHIDGAVKYIDVDTVMVAQSKPGHVWHDDLETMAGQLAETPSATGQNYEVIRIPLPEDFPAGYINSLTLNGKVIIPLFGVEEDEIAHEIYRKSMRDHEIVGINYRDFPVGAVHCQSKEMPPITGIQ